MSIDLSLVRVRRLFSLLPPYRRPTIHVAGTNGKGSVTAILSSIFTSSHVSVGRFNSPHLVHVWDSISINGHSVSQNTYQIVRNEIEKLNKTESIGATSFEIMTATAAQIFEQAHVDIAIFEVGLGGRLDATNVLPDSTIIASVITSVDKDHQQFLGNTPAAIAREKAGIVRKGKPCILGAQTHPEVRHAVQEVVHVVGGRLVQAMEVLLRDRSISLQSESFPEGCQSVTTRFQPWSITLDLELPLHGAHQRQNLAVALTVISVIIESCLGNPIEAALNRISPSTLYTGVFKTKWPGRLERIHLLDPPLTLLVDGAHNAASAAALQSYLVNSSVDDPNLLPSSRSSRTFIIGLSHSPPKMPFDTLSPLLQPGDHVGFVHFTDVEDMPWVKNVPFSELEQVARCLVKGGSTNLFERKLNETPLGPLKRSLLWAAQTTKAEVVLAGSLYLVADLYRLQQHEKYY